MSSWSSHSYSSPDSTTVALDISVIHKCTKCLLHSGRFATPVVACVNIWREYYSLHTAGNLYICATSKMLGRQNCVSEQKWWLRTYSHTGVVMVFLVLIVLRPQIWVSRLPSQQWTLVDCHLCQWLWWQQWLCWRGRTWGCLPCQWPGWSVCTEALSGAEESRKRNRIKTLFNCLVAMTITQSRLDNMNMYVYQHDRIDLTWFKSELASFLIVMTNGGFQNNMFPFIPYGGDVSFWIQVWNSHLYYAHHHEANKWLLSH